MSWKAITFAGGVGLVAGAAAVAAILTDRISSLESELVDLRRDHDALRAPVETVQQDVFSLFVEINSINQALQTGGDYAPRDSAPVQVAGAQTTMPSETARAAVPQRIYQPPQQFQAPYVDPTEPLRADGTTNRERHALIQQKTGTFAPFFREDDDD
ncbi:MAG: hypothetical protein AAFN07_12740 [Pseudomonadota bacterium]